MSGTTGRKFLGLHPFFAPKNGWKKKHKSYFAAASFLFYIINIINTSLRRISVRTTRQKGASPGSECEVDGSAAKSTAATSEKEIQDSA